MHQLLEAPGEGTRNDRRSRKVVRNLIRLEDYLGSNWAQSGPFGLLPKTLSSTSNFINKCLLLEYRIEEINTAR